MFMSIMSEQRVVTVDEPVVELQTEIVREIKKNVASLKSSIDQILHDMEHIRTAKLEILERLNSVRNENSIDCAQIQATFGKARKIMRKSEENRRKLELVLGKMSEFNLVHTFTNFAEPGIYDLSDPRANQCDVEAKENQLSKQERIKLRILENNKYTLTSAESKDERDKLKTSFKWGRDSALRELQWIVKMKLYKLRHRYDKLPFEQEVEERTPLPVSWRRVSGERA